MSNAPITTLVVDDEPLARERVLRLLARTAGFSLLGAVGSVAQALKLETPAPPELLLLDVRMPARDGFELLQRWSDQGIEPFVIFITAYSDHAVKAFEVDAVDYVLKPFDDERFMKALARARAAIESSRQTAAARGAEASADRGAHAVAAAAAEPKFPERLLISEDGRVLFLPARDIEFVQSAGKYIKVYAQGQCHLLRQPMHELESRLDPNQFVRVHRSSIVNVEQIIEMHPLFHGDYELVLRRGTRLAMSRRFRNRFDRFLAAD
jgi:two-component system LytT family response regulator